jgi:hypothetical protein
VVLTGDALVTHDGLIGHTGTGPQIIGPVFTHDTAQAQASLQALTSLDAGVVLPGHGDPFHGAIADAVTQALHAPILIRRSQFRDRRGTEATRPTGAWHRGHTANGRATTSRPDPSAWSAGMWVMCQLACRQNRARGQQSRARHT